MSGFGYGGSLRGGRGGTGICFVKSAEILNRDPQPEPVDIQDKSDLCPPPPNTFPDEPVTAPNPQYRSYVKSPLENSSDKELEPPVHRGMQQFVKSREKYSSLNSGAHVRGHRGGYQMPGSVNLNKDLPRGTFSPVAPAQPLASKEEYLAAWRHEKDPVLAKFRKLAYEVVSLKTARPNGKDKLHSAANRVPIHIEFNSEPVFGANRSNSFVCYVFMDGISIAAGYGLRIKDAKTNAYELALQKIFMSHFRVFQVSSASRELQASNTPFVSPPPEVTSAPKSSVPSTFIAKSSQKNKDRPSQYKESNMEAAGFRHRWNEFKPLEDFVIVEPLIPIPDCTPVHTLRRSADFNHMLIEYEYYFQGDMPRCVLKIENQVLADVSGATKISAKNLAAADGLKHLKRICWGIKTKNNNNSDTKINKDLMLNELNDQTDVISQDNIGNKLLRKMGWSGGGVGKDGSGIAEPVSLNSVLNREGFGLSATRGITDDFRRKIKEVIENYAASDNQEDLLFSCDFLLDERKIIHNECRRLNLRSKSRGKGDNRYLCVRRKRSVNQLFDHIMSCGGETPKYKLIPPGSDSDMMSSYDQVTDNCSVGDGQQCFMNGPIPLMGGPFLGDPSYAGRPSKSRGVNKFNSDSVLPASSDLMGYEMRAHAGSNHSARENLCRESNIRYGHGGNTNSFNTARNMRSEFEHGEVWQDIEDCERDMFQNEMAYSPHMRNESSYNSDREILDRPWGNRTPNTHIAKGMHTSEIGGKWDKRRPRWGQTGFPYNKYQPM